MAGHWSYKPVGAGSIPVSRTRVGVNGAMRYTREVLTDAVARSRSVYDVLRVLGLRLAGGTHAHVSRRIKEFDLDTAHFLGRASNCGPDHLGGVRKRPWQAVLVKRVNGKRQIAVRLRRALIEAGVTYRCADCGCEGIWRGKPLKLQVEHKNRDWLDDRKENLEFLCPNCHSQTCGWCNDQGGTDVTTDAAQYRNRRKRANGGIGRRT